MSSKRMDWCTPLNVLGRIYQFDKIGLDPCGNANSEVIADEIWTEGGLDRPWHDKGLVYVNPPYGRGIGDWIAKCNKTSHDSNADIIALVPARTDTEWFRSALCLASRICLIRGRLRFQDAPSSAPFPSALIYWGDRTERFWKIFTEGEWGLVMGVRR